jgi:hypothetical protein
MVLHHMVRHAVHIWQQGPEENGKIHLKLKTKTSM